MTGLAFGQAPPPSLPLRFLLAAPAWGVVAGAWLALHGTEIMASRWTPATLVLVHVLALGVLGNAMLGSLVQFLPVAAGSPMPGRRAVPALHLAFNAGIAALLPALVPGTAVPAALAAVLLGGSLCAFATLALAGLARGSGPVATRAGIAAALLALLATMAMGLRLLAARHGWLGPLAWPLVDLHAATGIGGWMLGLLVAVGATAMPMLQGTAAWTTRQVAIAWALLATALVVAAAAAAGAVPARAWRVVALPLAPLALAAWWRQWWAPHHRGPVLRRFWASGCIGLLFAVAIAAWPEPLAFDRTLAVAALVLAVALPLLVVGMLLEIVAFLAWIRLRQQVPRGTRIPGVGSLFPGPDKRRVWTLHVLASLATVAAVARPTIAGAAGIAMAWAYAATLRGAWRCWRTPLSS